MSPVKGSPASYDPDIFHGSYSVTSLDEAELVSPAVVVSAAVVSGDEHKYTLTPNVPLIRST